MEDKIKDIFKEFDPELSSSFQFIAKLEKNMEAVEIVRQFHSAQKRRNLWAVAIAGMAGFTVGVVMTLLFPFITEWIASFNFSIALPHSSTVNFDFRYLAWLLVAALSVITSVGVYWVANSCSYSINTREQRY